MLRQMTFDDLPGAISLQELADGITLSGSPDGQQIGQSGRGVARANRTRLPGNKKATRTNVTSGPSSSGSSASVDLTRSLVNRLKERFATGGSMEYRQTWKEKVTPLGIVYWAHTASGHPTSDSGCTGWPTPVAQHANGTPEDFLRRKRESVERGNSMGITLSDLNMVAQLAGWPTPMSRDHFPSHTDEYIAEKKAQGHGMSNLNDVAAIAGWNTPRATDGTNGGPNQTGGALPADAALISGQTQSSSPAGTAKRGVLNPALSRWLMGYPVAWDSCGATAMRSCRKSRRNSSKRSSKREVKQ